jgi:hypothetical protein
MWTPPPPFRGVIEPQALRIRRKPWTSGYFRGSKFAILHVSSVECVQSWLVYGGRAVWIIQTACWLPHRSHLNEKKRTQPPVNVFIFPRNSSSLRDWITETRHWTLTWATRTQSLTHWLTVSMGQNSSSESVTQSGNSSLVMEPEGPFSHSQESVTGSCRQPDESSPKPPTLFLQDQF